MSSLCSLHTCSHAAACRLQQDTAGRKPSACMLLCKRLQNTLAQAAASASQTSLLLPLSSIQGQLFSMQ